MSLADVIAAGYVLDREDRFEGATLDAGMWIPSHLAHWSSAAQAAARYRLDDGHLELRVAHDQPPWCPEFDGGTRVSSLQTGSFSGPLGSTTGQHRFNDRAVVREVQPLRRLYTPHRGIIEMRARVLVDVDSMAALWMIGVEEVPERSGEICVCEIFGRDVADGGAGIGMGIHPFGDPSLEDDFAVVRVPIDVRAWHGYAVEWTADRVGFFVDGEEVRTVPQSPDYPMQLMLGVYDFGDPQPDRPEPRIIVDHVRGYRPVAAL